MKTIDVRQQREVRRRESYRGTILDAAERVILRKGYSALTMDDVAREAQLSKATVYKYVAGKGSLLFEILGHSFDEVRDEFAAILAGPGRATEKLERLIKVAIRRSEDKIEINRVLWMDKAMLRLMRLFVPPSGRAGAAPSGGDKKMLSMFRQKRQAMIDLGARILEEGVASGEFRRMDTAQAAAFIESVLQGYTHMRFWEGEAPPDPRAAEGLTRFIIEGIRNPGQAGKEK
jgi:TetR/AcrR family acrAB operon transcriptional repressor